eukprot:358017-Chlamydomonas_euryale.AAC.1
MAVAVQIAADLLLYTFRRRRGAVGTLYRCRAGDVEQSELLEEEEEVSASDVDVGPALRRAPDGAAALHTLVWLEFLRHCYRLVRRPAPDRGGARSSGADDTATAAASMPPPPFRRGLGAAIGLSSGVSVCGYADLRTCQALDD